MMGPGSKAGMNRQVMVVRRARGVPTPDCFQIVDSAVPQCPAGGVLLETLCAAVDPAMRGWLSQERNYMTVSNGEVMRAHGVGRVVESQDERWVPGDLAYGWLGWQRYAAVASSALLWPVDETVAPAPVWLSVLGLNGLTAWIGLNLLGRPARGETIVVSAAAGGVGGLVGQLAAHRGLRAVGIAGGARKTELARTQLGFHAAVDYKAAAGDLGRELAGLLPDGVDIFFDNTAGPIADAVFPVLNGGARIVQCGTVAVPDWTTLPTGPRRERDILVKRLSWHGLVVFDHVARFEEAFADLKDLYRGGVLTARHDVLRGLDMAPGALGRLYDGTNNGRLMIDVAV